MKNVLISGIITFLNFLQMIRLEDRSEHHEFNQALDLLLHSVDPYGVYQIENPTEEQIKAAISKDEEGVKKAFEENLSIEQNLRLLEDAPYLFSAHLIPDLRRILTAKNANRLTEMDSDPENPWRVLSIEYGIGDSMEEVKKETLKRVRKLNLDSLTEEEVNMDVFQKQVKFLVSVIRRVSKGKFENSNFDELKTVLKQTLIVIEMQERVEKVLKD